MIIQAKEQELAPTLSHLFELQVLQSPDSVAVRSTAGDCSYALLNQKANQIAHALLDCGSGPKRVALYLDQGIEAISAMLGALKAGTCYTPLDSSDPQERTLQILADCAPDLVLTCTAHYSVLESLLGDRCKLLDISTLGTGGNSNNPVPRHSPDSLAYIFYTSGSTGQPKGVCQTHKNVVHYIRNYTSTLGIVSDDRLSLLYSLSFSASNMDIFGALLNGATLCQYDVRKQATGNLRSWLYTQSITVLHMVPTLFRHLLKTPGTNEQLSSIRVLDLGGEKVYQSDLEMFRQHFDEQAIFVNHFAATEISVICQLALCSNENVTGDPLPVGLAGHETEIRILDAEYQPVAPGTTGEIHIFSPYLSPGYWNQPELSASVFDTDVARPELRSYKSGDLGYLDENNHLRLAGRSDAKVKVRGHSVDLTEVEAGIRRLGLASDVVVFHAGGTEGSLTACLNGVKQMEQQATAIRSSLSAELPLYMIPTEVRFYDEFPKTASGKIDRSALSEDQLPNREIAGLDATKQEYDEREHVVAMLFTELLANKQHAPDDSFFALGGDSLLFAALHSALEESFGLFISIEDILKNPSIQGIAAMLARNTTGVIQNEARLVPVRPEGEGTPFYLVHGAQGNAFVSPQFIATLGNNRPFFAFQARGLDGLKPPHPSIASMASDYISEMKCEQATGPYFLGGICAGGIVALEMAQQLRDAGDTMAPLLLIDPPLRALPKTGIDLYRMVRGQIGYFRRRISHRLNLHGTQQQRAVKFLRERLANGALTMEQGKSIAFRSAVSVQHRLQLSLARHHRKPYTGKVCLLASEYRLQADYRGFGLTGEVRRYPVEGDHNDVLNVNNDVFATQMRSCMQYIQAELDKQ